MTTIYRWLLGQKSVKRLSANCRFPRATPFVGFIGSPAELPRSQVVIMGMFHETKVRGIKSCFYSFRKHWRASVVGMVEVRGVQIVYYKDAAVSPNHWVSRSDKKGKSIRLNHFLGTYHKL